MKNLLKTCALVGMVAALGACAGSPSEDDTFATPYTLERTAIGEPKAAPAPEPVPVAQPAPAPVVQQCDYSAWEAKVAKLEGDLAACLESSSRVRDAYREELTK